MTDADFETESYRQYAEGYVVERLTMMWFFDHYVPNVADRSLPDIAPLRAESLNGLPPTMFIHAGYDPLRDEGVAYADRLREAGVEVESSMYDDHMHGFFTIPNFLERANEAIAEVGAFASNAVSAQASG